MGKPTMICRRPLTSLYTISVFNEMFHNLGSFGKKADAVSYSGGNSSEDDCKLRVIGLFLRFSELSEADWKPTRKGRAGE